MEIERKFLIKELPEDLSRYPIHILEQGYLCTSPVVRIRKNNERYELTYKSKGMMIREEYNLPLTAESYAHLKDKIDGRLIRKKGIRFLMVLILLSWIFSKVTMSTLYHNSALSKL